ncbi:MAG TPA: acyl-CoA dehydrogenase family protein [Pseudonocardiaceae bacterium]|nr:acyl-CoA dehydrogenase family protein [Pseudonocardiaceae bacterium]
MLERAHTIAEGVLFPAAAEVDAQGVIPRSHFDLLAEQGFYGLAADPEHGGAEVSLADLAEIMETLAGGCLATTFTWMQHHRVVRALTRTANPELREKYSAAAIRGEVRAGVAYAGAIPRPPLLWASATDGGWLLSGEAPFVTGWGLIDLLQVAARNRAIAEGHSEGAIIFGLIDPVADAGITIEPMRLVAAQGSNTVRLRFADYPLPAEKVTAEISSQDFLAGQPRNVRLSGCLPTGIATRCIRMIGEAGRGEIAEALSAQRDVVRHRFDTGLQDPARLPAVRAAAAELAYRSAGALVVAVGSRGIVARAHAQRLVREATFTLVAGGRPEIKESLLEMLDHVHG